MKKTLSLLVLITALTGMLLVQPSGAGYAQGQGPSTPTPYPGESEFITFSMLGIQDEVMLGPFATSFIRFSTPESWALEPGAKMILELETTVRSSRPFVEDISEYSGALMEVTVNDHVVDVIFLRTGVQTVEITFPEEALYPTREDGRHSIQIFLDATIDCLFDHETAVLVRSASGFTLPHHDKSPVPNLTLLPRPIYKMDSLLPEKALLVVPDAPTKEELQSAMIVAASLGRMTEGLQEVSLVSPSSMTELEKANAHVILVGKQDSLPLLSEVSFPATVTGSNPSQKVEASDGTVQMAVSPWNASRVVLYFGGVEDAAVVKAAQAFSSGVLRVGKHASLAVISNVADAIEVKDVPDDRTLASLGYITQTLSGVGYNAFEYEFFVPLGKEPTGDSFFDLIYSHSAIFDYDASGAVIFLNDEALGSVRFSTATANKVTPLNINIPAYAIRSGRNVISVQAEFVPFDYCSTLNNDGLWMSISQDSLLHIPLVDVNPVAPSLERDLGLFPSPFTDSPTLDKLAFVFPSDDVSSWALGSKIAANLGQDAIGKILTPSVFFADDIPDDARANMHLLLVGQASRLAVISELTDTMPAGFEPGSDVAIEDGIEISYNIPSDTDLGYLELLPAPWDASKSILAVMGSTPLGLEWAGNALVDPLLKPEMRGDYVVVHAEKMYAVDTALGLGTQNLSATAVPGAYPTLIPDTVPVTSIAYQQDWVRTAVIITSAVILIFLLGVIVVSLRRRRHQKK
ncbi:MAG: cellulose biosynthesis cyclic di-GMP-binding regulatory protein BcsB [Chloroflexi bacterium]|nr:cellulose biosynthesis cyclic di-GMP-binding regulatory protein BcsB [Chloroflexota bacterium]